MRDKLKSKDFFDNAIEFRQNDTNEARKELKAGEIAPDRVADYSMFIFDFSLNILFAKYSRGDDKKSLMNSYLEAIDDMHYAFPLYYTQFEDSNEFLDFDLTKVLMMISFGILLDIEGEPFEKLLRSIRIVKKPYRLLEYMLSYFGNEIATSEMTLNERHYKDFIVMFDKTNEEIESKNMMYKYLQKWHKDEDRVYMHSSYSLATGGYVGNWSFESAAFIKMRGLDDSSFRDSPYYPKDLL